MLRADLHHLDGLVGCDFKNVQQLRIGIAIANELYNFVNASVVGANIEDFVFLIRFCIADSMQGKMVSDCWFAVQATYLSTASLVKTKSRL